MSDSISQIKSLSSYLRVIERLAQSWRTFQAQRHARLAQQWRERLAANTITGGRAGESDDSRWRAAEQEIRSAQAQWMRLGPVPQGEFRLHRFLMTRAVVAARMLGKQPLGAFWRPGSRGGVASQQATAKAAREGRMMGFSGCVCATPEQVAAVNEGFAAP